MGKRGPKPTPSAILMARDSWRGKQRVAEGEPAPPPQMPACPFAEADTEHRAVWDDLSAMLAGLRVLTLADQRALERYTREWVRYRRCARHVAEHGESYQTVDQAGNVILRPTPESRTALSLQSSLNQLEDRFGLTPAARCSIRVPEPEKAADSSAAHFGAA